MMFVHIAPAVSNNGGGISEVVKILVLHNVKTSH